MHNKMYNAHQVHTSAECKFLAKGHIKDATFLNMCGGNNCICCNEKERVVFQYIPWDNEKNGKCKHKNTLEKPKKPQMKLSDGEDSLANSMMLPT